jgi:hypothetical protein
MAVTRKPQIQTPPAAMVDVEALILKGGSPVGEAPPLADKAGNKVSPVILRIPSDLLGKIEEVRGTRPVKIPRHTWLLEAIVEKLQREARNSA